VAVRQARELAAFERAVCEQEVAIPLLRVRREAADLLRRMLAKSPQQRLTLQGVAEHPWLTRGGREPLRLEHTREAASEAEVSEALVEVVQLELDLAGDPPAHTSHAREDGGLSAWLRRYRSEAWGQPAAATGGAGGAVANKQVRLVVTSSRGSDSKDGSTKDEGRGTPGVLDCQ
jgi:serine/threonine protein kinase